MKLDPAHRDRETPAGQSRRIVLGGHPVEYRLIRARRRSIGMEVHLDGLTVRVAGLAVTSFCTKPSDQVTVHGPVPLNTALTRVELPLQIVAFPLASAVGRALTVITALPVRSPLCAVHRLSPPAVTV